MEWCRVLLWLLGWVPFGASVVVLILFATGSPKVPTLPDALGMTFGGLVAGALLHAAAHALTALDEISRAAREIVRKP